MSKRVTIDIDLHPQVMPNGKTLVRPRYLVAMSDENHGKPIELRTGDTFSVRGAEDDGVALAILFGHTLAPAGPTRQPEASE